MWHVQLSKKWLPYSSKWYSLIDIASNRTVWIEWNNNGANQCWRALVCVCECVCVFILSWHKQWHRLIRLSLPFIAINAQHATNMAGMDGWMTINHHWSLPFAHMSMRSRSHLSKWTIDRMAMIANTHTHTLTTHSNGNLPMYNGVAN